jgi:hypothetical protein
MIVASIFLGVRLGVEVWEGLSVGWRDGMAAATVFATAVPTAFASTEMVGFAGLDPLREQARDAAVRSAVKNKKGVFCMLHPSQCRMMEV